MEDACSALDSVGALFGEQLPCHGDADTPYVYKYRGDSSANVTFVVKLPRSDVDLMAHYVWEAAIKLTDLVCSGRIDVSGKSVLELGAGSGLPSLAAVTKGASRVLCTDYPDEAILLALQENIAENLSSKQSLQHNIKVAGHAWGTPLRGCTQGETFDLILFADCLWLGDQQRSLLTSLRDYLKPGSGLAYLTFQHHTDDVKEFFNLTDEFGLVYEELDALPWGGKTLEEFDPEDEEADGPVYFGVLKKSIE